MERTSTLNNKTEKVRVIPITLVDSAVDDAEAIYIDSSKRINKPAVNTVTLSDEKSCQEVSQTFGEEKTSLGQMEQKSITKSSQFEKITQAQSYSLKETNKNDFKVEKDAQDNKLPPLEDPSIILLSPTPVRRSKSLSSANNLDKSYEDDYTDLESLAEEVHHVKEGKARELIYSKLKDSISDMVAYQKHIDEEHKPKNHYEELRESQRKAQKDFHAKLFQELAKETSGGKKTSKVAEALGTKFEVRSTASNAVYDQQTSGFNSVPSKSPNMSRRGSNNTLNTWMNKSKFWSNSLPRPQRRVTFVDETLKSCTPPPERPPPPPPARQQSINTMQSLSSISTVYNQTLCQETESQKVHHDVQDVHTDNIHLSPMQSGTSRPEENCPFTREPANLPQHQHHQHSNAQGKEQNNLMTNRDPGLSRNTSQLEENGSIREINSLQSVEYREFYKNRRGERQAESEYKLDLGLPCHFINSFQPQTQPNFNPLESALSDYSNRRIN